jgi:hypothetical protein
LITKNEGTFTYELDNPEDRNCSWEDGLDWITQNLHGLKYINAAIAEIEVW